MTIQESLVPPYADPQDKLYAERTRLLARIAEIEKALWPFAREAASMIDKYPEWFTQDGSGVDFIRSAVSTTEWWNAAKTISPPIEVPTG